MFLTIGAVLVLAAGVAVIYNQLVRDRNRVNAAWSDIDVQLQRRHDLVPQLVDAVRGYAGYERAALEAVTALRNEAAGLEPEALLEGVGGTGRQVLRGVRKGISGCRRSPPARDRYPSVDSCPVIRERAFRG